MTWSEFGRRAQDNGSNGTDHGAAAPHFVVGDAVKPGIYGGPPNLARPRLQRKPEDRERLPHLLRDPPLGLARSGFAAILGQGWPNLGFLNKSYA